jgi:hypothetical protein
MRYSAFPPLRLTSYRILLLRTEKALLTEQFEIVVSILRYVHIIISKFGNIYSNSLVLILIYVYIEGTDITFLSVEKEYTPLQVMLPNIPDLI